MEFDRMRGFAYRKVSRVVSILQLLFYPVGSLFVIYCGTVFAIASNTLFDSQEDSSPPQSEEFCPNSNNIPPLIFWACVMIKIMILAAIMVLQLFASVELFRATAVDISVPVALAQAKFWRDATILFTAFSLFVILPSFSWFNLVTTLINCLINGMFIVLVWSYIGEMQVVSRMAGQGASGSELSGPAITTGVAKA